MMVLVVAIAEEIVIVLVAVMTVVVILVVVAVVDVMKLMKCWLASQLSDTPKTSNVYHRKLFWQFYVLPQ